ncbi:3'-5' exonuclease [Pusillimonas sp. SM2304]|uniref:3'-5' exonuclease n=1 Tax=Pusillimonas sp. SM2304 TaxID=3073241 RepID=UPI0028755E41|nr:3'-5' exonuclease [Pusillimonas sp. SM2304]MDS1141754.1 3'-5' exonuclease [Pusillimonas sp. SM2304]
MNYGLFYDTETTGLPLFAEPSEDPRQPHIVQLAAALVDLDTRKTVSSIDVIIKPNGWTIPDEVAAIHGITTEKAHDLGIAEESAVAMFLGLWNGRTRIAHNETFDARILRIALKRFPAIFSESLGDKWKAGATQCTAKLATPIVKCPPTAKMIRAGRNHYKTANLTEAYTHFFGQAFDGAHSAMADVDACKAVYFAIQDLSNQESVEP